MGLLEKAKKKSETQKEIPEAVKKETPPANNDPPVVKKEAEVPEWRKDASERTRPKLFEGPAKGVPAGREFQQAWNKPKQPEDFSEFEMSWSKGGNPPKKEEQVEDRQFDQMWDNPHTTKLKEPNVQEQKKKPASLIRVRTGIDGMDEIMEGGFEEFSINLVVGGSGSGKSIFAMQYLYNGALRYNEPGIYITFEERRENFIKHMKQFGWDIEKLEKNNLFRLIEYTPQQIKKLIDEGGGMIENVIEVIKAKRLVIDSITAVSLLQPTSLARRELLLSLFDMIRKWNLTALLIGERESEIGRHEPDDIEFESDSVLLLYNTRKDTIRERSMEILKMRGTKHKMQVFPLKINDTGIVVYPDAPVF